jgi:hypothetical protein
MKSAKNSVPNTLYVPLVIGLLVLAGAAPAAAQSNNDKSTSAGATIAQDPAANRNSYTNNAHGEMHVWAKKLVDFNARMETSATEVQTNDFKSLDSAWAETKTAWIQLVKVELNEGTDGATDWDSAKASFQTASQRLAVAWKKVNPDVQ